MLRDKIIQQLANKSVQERLIRKISKKRKNLEEIVAECKSSEPSTVQTANQVSDQVGRLTSIKSFKG